MEFLKQFLLRVVYPIFYRLGAMRPLRQKAVFSEIRSKQMSDSFSLLYEELRQRGDTELSVVFCDNLRGNSVQLVLDTLRFLWEASNARVIFVNDSANFYGAFSLRRGSSMVQVWHACGAFKKWGFSVADRRYGSSRKDMEKTPYHKNYTLVPVSGEAVSFAYEEAFGLPGNTGIVQPLGSSRTDIFYREDFRKKAREELNCYIPRARDKKVLLYAPTFRGQARDAEAPNVMHAERWQEQLGDAYVLVIKQHPFVKERPEVPENCREFAADLTGIMDMERLLAAADVLITDYSSCIFEFSLLERPMFFWAYDREIYDDWRGFYFPYETFVPGPIASSEEELLTAIREEAWNPEQVRGFRRAYMGACDGHATERILHRVLPVKE